MGFRRQHSPEIMIHGTRTSTTLSFGTISTERPQQVLSSHQQWPLASVRGEDYSRRRQTLTLVTMLSAVFPTSRGSKRGVVPKDRGSLSDTLERVLQTVVGFSIFVYRLGAKFESLQS